MTSAKPDIAIIGMSCIFPGAADQKQYWENILRKVDAVSDPPADWESNLYYDSASTANDRTYCRRGGYLGDLASFDPSRYGVVPNSVDGTEPDHFLALRSAHDALANAGYSDIGQFRERTAVIVGRGTYVNRGNMTAMQHGAVLDSVIRILSQLHPEHLPEDLERVREALKASIPPFHPDTAPGLVPNIITGRIANRLDLMGPNYIVDAACASSLVAVDHAVRDLRSGRCDMAVAGGVNASVPPIILIIFSQLKALSRKGQIRPFDANADGTLLGEGVGMVVLKRLEDAERDGDKIHALIKGVGVASDGKATGLLAPRLEGEQLALRLAYEDSGVFPETVGLIEAHGTATAAGDAVELAALASVLGENGAGKGRCAIGSVKSMISHTMPAAGIAGLIKTALALQHKVLPPTLHCDEPNPKLNPGASRFYLNSETRPWIHGDADNPRRAGVNAFGFGGINAHAVLEEYTGPNQASWQQHFWDHEMFVVSAKDSSGLAVAAGDALSLVRSSAESTPLRNLAWTLNCQHELQPSRLTIVAANRGELISKLERAAERLEKKPGRRIRDVDGMYFYPDPLGLRSRVAFVYPGEGSQYTRMLLDTCLHFSEARQWFDLMEEAFEGQGRHSRLSETIYPVPGTADASLYAMDIGAEAAFCANQAIHAVLERLGIRPQGMAGHSTGEHSALLNSGIVHASDRSALLRYIRGVNAVFEKLTQSTGIEHGALIAVAGANPLSLSDLANATDGVYVALDNCPNQVVLFCREDRIRLIEDALGKTTAVCQRLPFGRAYHTPLFCEFSAELRQFFDSVSLSAPQVPVYSCVSAGLFPADTDEVRSLVSVQWESTVRFRETIEAMYRDGFRIFVEAGPRGSLTGCVGDILRGRDHAALASDVQHRTGIHQLQHLIAELVAMHVPVAMDKLYEHRDVSDSRTPQPLSTSQVRIAMGLQPLRLPEGFTLPSTKPAVPPAVEGAAPRGTRADVVSAQMQVMNQFLQTQQQMMQTWLATKNTPAGQLTAGPFITRVTEHLPGTQVTAEIRLSLAEHPMFMDHTLGRTVSEADPGLSGLSVVPLTLTLELLAEGAALLAPGKVLTGMRDVRAARWLSLERGFLELEVTAQPDSSGQGIYAVIREGGTQPLRPILAEGTVLFAERRAKTPNAARLSLRSETPSAWTADRLYSEGMFHGPAFRGVRSMDRTGSNGAKATLQALPRLGLFRRPLSPGFLLDPVVLDAAGQVVAFWSQEVLQPSGDIFPYRFAELECWSDPPTVGTLLDCAVEVTHISDDQIHSNIEIAGPDKRLVYRIRKWEDRRFTLPRNLWSLRISPATAWTGNIERVRNRTSARVGFPTDLMESSHRIWSKVLAHLVLSRTELEAWYSLPVGSPEIYQWLFGRCAAKDAVRALVKDAADLLLYPADVVISEDDTGRLHASGFWLDKLIFQPLVSVTHSNGAAVAVASAPPENSVNGQSISVGTLRVDQWTGSTAVISHE